MKIRNGFVSNSSSSSFIVISKKGSYSKPKWDKKLIVDHNFGGIEFGWGPGKVSDSESKIIFSYFQAEYADKDEWVKMLEDIIKETVNVKTIQWKITTLNSNSDDYGYIDHQSVDDRNTKMFDSKKELKDFIFNNDSYIILDNDNH